MLTSVDIAHLNALSLTPGGAILQGGLRFYFRSKGRMIRDIFLGTRMEITEIDQV